MCYASILFTVVAYFTSPFSRRPLRAVTRQTGFTCLLPHARVREVAASVAPPVTVTTEEEEEEEEEGSDRPSTKAVAVGRPASISLPRPLPAMARESPTTPR